MRTTRALIAGAGATGSMIAAAACVFMVASAVVAYNGWPSAGIPNRVNNLFVDDKPAVAWDVSGTRAVAAGTAPAAGAVASAPTGPPAGAPAAGVGTPANGVSPTQRGTSNGTGTGAPSAGTGASGPSSSTPAASSGPQPGTVSVPG